MAILYKANETDFNHLGLGPLNDAVSILVTEERNGMFELEMKYPIEGSRFVDLKLDRMIKADAGYNLKNQRFKIIRITKPIDGIVTVNAEHVSYLTQDLALKPTVNYSGNASQALAIWKNNIVDSNPFIVSSDITTTGSGSWSITDVKNAREALGGVKDSLLETYGGEFRFDNYHVRLMAQRGVNSGALIAYGRNLTDFTQEESIADTFTSVYPYSVYQDKNNKEVLLTLPEYFVDSEYVNNYARRKILPVDFSDKKIKDVTTLRNRANSYVKSNGIGIPKVNMKIKYIDLAKTLDYKDLAVLEEINLCDNVFVYFEQLGVNTSAKIIKTVWDDLIDQYDSIEVGEAKSSLSNAINSTVDGKLEMIVQRVNTIQLTADGLNVIHRGPEEPPPGNIGDLWYEPDGIYENMYQWDGSIWKLMLSTRDLGVLKQEVESVIAQAETDRTEAVQKINQAVIDSKVYADEVTTVSALRTKVLASDVITADMIQSNVSVVDKLFATDANVNVLTAKTAFINAIKATTITADKVTGGTANFANFNAINFNANSITTGTISGANSDWNLNTGIMNFRDPSTGDNLKFAQGRIEFQNGAQGRQLLYNAEGLQIRPFSSNTGTSRNTALHLIGGGTGSYQYIQFISGDGIQHRIESEDRNITLYHSAGGGGVRVANYGGNTWGGSVESGIFKTAHTTGNVIQMAGERIETPRFGDRNIRLMPNGTGSVIAGDGNGNQWNMVARTFVQQSTRASKTNIETYTGSALEVVNRLEVATFNMIQELQLGINVRKVGFIAEDSEPIAVKQDGVVVGIDTYTTSAYLVKAVQELDVRTATETDKLKARVTELERKVRQLEEAA